MSARESMGTRPPEPATPARQAPAARQLAFEQIEVRSMPGFRRGGFALKDLSPGINVIHGPNGAGKTTTARAIETLLWPREPGAGGSEDALFGRFRFDGATWTVEIAPGRRIWQRNGSPAEAPAFPGETGRDRYRLSLAELLQEEDRAFAEQIVRESAGGYDIAQAVERLGFRKRPSGYSNAGKALQDALQRVADATRAQQELSEEELRLGALEAARAEAAAAAERAETLDRLVELAEAQAQEERLRQQLSIFPEWSEGLTGEEVEHLDRWRAEQREAAANLRAAEDAATRARREMAEARLPEDGLPLHQWQALQEQLDTLRQLDREWRDGKRREAEAQAVLEEEERRLGGPVASDRLAVLGTLELGQLRRAVEKAEDLVEERRRVETELRHLGVHTESPDESRLMQGIALLARWLRSPDGAAAARMHRLSLAVAVAAVMVTLAGSLLAGGAPIPVAVSALIGLLAAWGAVRLLGRAPGDLRAGPRQEYQGMGLEPPDAWTDEAVARRLDGLLNEVALAKEASRRADRRRALQADLTNLDEQSAALEAPWTETVELLGLPATTTLHSLLWFAERIGAWQKAHIDLEGESAAVLQVERERSNLVAKLAGALGPFGYPGLQTVEELAGALGALERRRDQWEKALQDEQAARTQAERARSEAIRVEGEIRRLFQRLGLDPEDTDAAPRLRRAVTDLPRYRELRRMWHEASWRMGKARERVEAEAGEGVQVPAIPHGAGLDELLQARQRATEEAASQQEYHDQITRTEERIRQAKQAHALEGALAARDAAVDQLRECFRQDAEAHLGAWLADWVQAENRDSERPHVFHQARRLFKEITAGRYSLELEDGREPIFRALETETGEGRALDELSSGTRVQLLLAVRVAFVETQEQGARLPLVFDEVLANSDDERAQAIMEAVVALARSGRQVFYFTAQWDEVAKWRQVLKGADLPHRFIDLAAIRRGDEAERRPLPVERPARPRVSAPEGRSYQEYGRLLQVPGVDPYSETVVGVHLWHLLDEAGDLHRLLQRGIERWGPLQALGEERVEELLGGQEPGVGTRIYRKASAAARVLEAILRSWRVGRGRPVDGQVLQASRAVSQNFLARAAELAEQYAGDARRLIDALERRELPRFHSSKLEALRAYLYEEGYLDDGEPLSAEEIRARAMAEAAEALGAGWITLEHVERLVQAVTG